MNQGPQEPHCSGEPQEPPELSSSVSHGEKGREQIREPQGPALAKQPQEPLFSPLRALHGTEDRGSPDTDEEVTKVLSRSLSIVTTHSNCLELPRIKRRSPTKRVGPISVELKLVDNVSKATNHCLMDLRQVESEINFRQRQIENLVASRSDPFGKEITDVSARLYKLVGRQNTLKNRTLTTQDISRVRTADDDDVSSEDDALAVYLQDSEQSPPPNIIVINNTKTDTDDDTRDYVSDEEDDALETILMGSESEFITAVGDKCADDSHGASSIMFKLDQLIICNMFDIPHSVTNHWGVEGACEQDYNTNDIDVSVAVKPVKKPNKATIENKEQQKIRAKKDTLTQRAKELAKAFAGNPKRLRVFIKNSHKNILWCKAVVREYNKLYMTTKMRINKRSLPIRFGPD